MGTAAKKSKAVRGNQKNHFPQNISLFPTTCGPKKYFCPVLGLSSYQGTYLILIFVSHSYEQVGLRRRQGKPHPQLSVSSESSKPSPSSSAPRSSINNEASVMAKDKEPREGAEVAEVAQPPVLTRAHAGAGQDRGGGRGEAAPPRG
jgi:hypothetical protein